MRIMLACAAGMSTSILVSKMEEAAKQQGKDYKIWAIDQSLIEEELGNFDVLLLGPQVQHTKRKVTRLVGDLAPVAVIKPVDYGRGDGAAVLQFAEELIEKGE
ncbi:PTS sugar transporter subunit IIB [Amphibacillus jilinensis]|uniref:PTS sugar transporter subunit IIB n=1 Tax=Amphibacillus jilinensis TaxID=1216008 RepID=UPI0002E6EFDB|nr:PTS sugar transporter subunit IIB [Amphibacillus jilinensis]